MAIAGHLFCSALFYSSGNQRDNPRRSIVFFSSCLRCKTEVGVCSTPTASLSSLPVSRLEGGKVVVELVGAFNDLMERMGGVISTTSASELLFKSLKLCIPLLRSLPYSNDNRPPLSRTLSVACLLADLQMDAEVISAGLLREAFEAGVVTMHDVKVMISASAAHLLHETL
ncbi:hypothetical protein HPP92_026060 [Vanilla planifolia]|uniref:HD domain-containing protein n=1 Tax=Vanilla planifolia TaxID=51239 RepID=A0A835PHI9_VANPL|nr:hypothetical protein HPP92_026060 [Vanilla planifolia]